MAEILPFFINLSTDLGVISVCCGQFYRGSFDQMYTLTSELVILASSALTSE